MAIDQILSDRSTHYEGLAVCLLGSSRRLRILRYLAQRQDQIIKTAEIRRCCRTNSEGYHRLFLELEHYGLMSKAPTSDRPGAQRRWAVEPHPAWDAIQVLIGLG